VKRIDRATRQFYLVHGTDEDRAELDAKLERVEGEVDRWWAPGPRGLGDRIAPYAQAIAGALGLKKGCGGCGKRQERLNELWPL